MSFYGRQAIIKFQILIISVNTWQVSLGTAESSKDVERATIESNEKFV